MGLPSEVVRFSARRADRSLRSDLQTLGSSWRLHSLANTSRKVRPDPNSRATRVLLYSPPAPLSPLPTIVPFVAFFPFANRFRLAELSCDFTYWRSDLCFSPSCVFVQLPQSLSFSSSLSPRPPSPPLSLFFVIPSFFLCFGTHLCENRIVHLCTTLSRKRHVELAPSSTTPLSL